MTIDTLQDGKYVAVFTVIDEGGSQVTSSEIAFVVKDPNKSIEVKTEVVKKAKSNNNKIAVK